jgi:hypothetical protein
MWGGALARAGSSNTVKTEADGGVGCSHCAEQPGGPTAQGLEGARTAKVVVLREEQLPQPVRFRHHPRQEYGAGILAAPKGTLNMCEEQGK